MRFYRYYSHDWDGVFQDLMPTKMGTATTLFSNAAKSSWIIGGPIAGIIAEIWHYNSVFMSQWL